MYRATFWLAVFKGQRTNKEKGNERKKPKVRSQIYMHVQYKELYFLIDFIANFLKYAREWKKKKRVKITVPTEKKL